MSEIGPETPGFERADADFMDILSKLDNELDGLEVTNIQTRTDALYARIVREIESAPSGGGPNAFSVLQEINITLRSEDLTEVDREILENIRDRIKFEYLKPGEN